MAFMITENAPAKINLYLHVVGRRPNGWHELDSLTMFADVGDRVTIEPGPVGSGPSLTVVGPFASALAGDDPGDNLVTRAIRLFDELHGGGTDVRVTLEKNLPVASGIGGGSADAAATLRAMARYRGVAIDDPATLAASVRLGADVPVCLGSRAMYFGGIGEILDPAPALPDVDAVLVNPGVPVSTPAVFKVGISSFSTVDRLDGPIADARGFARALAARRNDLTSPAIVVAPIVEETLARIAATPDCLLSRLSGSGATCFGLYPNAEASEDAARALAQAKPDWWIRPTRLTGRARS